MYQMNKVITVIAVMLAISINGFAADAPKVGEFVWNELYTPNLSASKEFYGNLFGWKFTDMPMGDTTYTLIRLNDKEFAGIWAIPSNMQDKISPHWMSYVLVENAEESLQKAVKLGARQIKEVTKAGDMGHFAIIADPTGAFIAFWQPNKG